MARWVFALAFLSTIACVPQPTRSDLATVAEFSDAVCGNSPLSRPTRWAVSGDRVVVIADPVTTLVFGFPAPANFSTVVVQTTGPDTGRLVLVGQAAALAGAATEFEISAIEIGVDQLRIEAQATNGERTVLCVEGPPVEDGESLDQEASLLLRGRTGS